jgi:NhaP-type Na+/H+ or K+/H+ antiporter
MSAVSLTAKCVQRTFRVDRKPNDLLFFDDMWEFINYLANSLLFLLIGFELALTNLALWFQHKLLSFRQVPPWLCRFLRVAFSSRVFSPFSSAMAYSPCKAGHSRQ